MASAGCFADVHDKVRLKRGMKNNSNRLSEARPSILERKPERKLQEKQKKRTEGESCWEWIER